MTSTKLKRSSFAAGADERAGTWASFIAVITQAAESDGLKEIVVRPFGPKQVEIVVPEVDPAEIEDIKDKIRTGGVLQFMIVASDERDGELLRRPPASRSDRAKIACAAT